MYIFISNFREFFSSCLEIKFATSYFLYTQIPYPFLTFNGPFAAEQSCGTKSPNWRTMQWHTWTCSMKKIQIWCLCLTYPSASFALQFDDFVPPNCSAAKGPLSKCTIPVRMIPAYLHPRYRQERQHRLDASEWDMESVNKAINKY